MPNWTRTHVTALSQETLSDAIFSGRILYFEQLAPMARVVGEIQALLQAVFAPHAPPSAHAMLGADEYKRRFLQAQEAFRASSRIRDGIHEAIGAAGAHLPDTFCDRLRLRVAPPRGHGADHPFFRSATRPHRDSWGSAIPSQINWWFPVFPLHPDRTLVFYPAHWTRPIANDVQGWDWKRIGKDPSTPRAPTAQAPLDTRDEIRVTVPPGTLVAFSAAHLHAGVENTTALARFSVETRTIYLGDLLADRGAPVVDGLAARPAHEWFCRIPDGQPLTEAVASAEREILSADVGTAPAKSSSGQTPKTGDAAKET